MTRDPKGTCVFPVSKAPSGVMPNKGFHRDLITPETAGSKNFSMHANILSAGVKTGDILHESEMGWYILSGRGWITMEGERYAIGPGDAIYAPATGGVHSFEVTPEQDLTYVLIFAPAVPVLGSSSQR
jgi:mannose-6-phosphate isomerase-like protein (cupin superfamily)